MESVAVSTINTVVPTDDALPEKIVVSDTELVVISDTATEVVVAGIMGPPGRAGISRIALAEDVDVSTLTDGSLLIYNANTLRWEASVTLDKHVLEAGQF